MPWTAATTTAMYSGRQPAMTALIATFSAVTDTDRFVMKASSCFGSRRAAASIMVTRSSVGGTTGKPSVQPCWKQNSLASTSSTRCRLDVSAAAMDPSSGTTFLAQQYSAAPGSPASARPDQRQDRSHSDRRRRHQQRLGERAEEADRRAAGRDDLARHRDARDDAERTRQEREAPRGALSARRKRGHDRGHVRHLEEAEPEPRDEERQRDRGQGRRLADEAERREARRLERQADDGGHRGADAIRQAAAHGRRQGRAERRQHEEVVAYERPEPPRLDQVERRQEPDREDRAPGDEGERARAQHGAERHVTQAHRPALGRDG